MTKTTLKELKRIAKSGKVDGPLIDHITYVIEEDSKISAHTLEERSYEQDMDHRRFWSYFIAGILVITIIFEMVFTRCVGLGYWKFDGNNYHITLVAVQNLTQVIGLAWVVNRYLFKNNK